MNLPASHVHSLPQTMQRFLTFYREFNQASVAQLSDYYHPDIEFCDPLHKIHGLSSLERYFSGMSEQLLFCEFEFLSPIAHGDTLVTEWEMRFKHKRLRSGQLLTLAGISHLTFSGDRVIRHRDYFDAGAMIYEHVPLLGRLVRLIKRRAQGDESTGQSTANTASQPVLLETSGRETS